MGFRNYEGEGYQRGVGPRKKQVILSLLYCSNSCTPLHFKILKSHNKTLKIRPYMFRSPLKLSLEGPWSYFVRLLNWNLDLHLLKRCVVM